MHEDVEEAAVIAVEHESRGEVPKAYIVLARNGTLEPNELNHIIFSIRKFVHAKVLPFKQLAGGIVVLPELPKTASGKIAKNQLKINHYNNANKTLNQRVNNKECIGINDETIDENNSIKNLIQQTISNCETTFKPYLFNQSSVCNITKTQTDLELSFFQSKKIESSASSSKNIKRLLEDIDDDEICNPLLVRTLEDIDSEKETLL